MSLIFYMMFNCVPQDTVAGVHIAGTVPVEVESVELIRTHAN